MGQQIGADSVMKEIMLESLDDPESYTEYVNAHKGRVWKHQNDEGGWEEYKEFTNYLIEKARKMCQPSVEIERTTFDGVQTRFRIDFLDMTEQNINTEWTRKITYADVDPPKEIIQNVTVLRKGVWSEMKVKFTTMGTRIYYNSLLRSIIILGLNQDDVVDIKERVLDYIHCDKESFFSDCPKRWVIPQSGDTVLLDVDVKSEEFLNVESYFKKSLKSAKLTKLTRIQNIPLWLRYHQMIEKMEETGLKINEHLLFAGTTKARIFFLARNKNDTELVKKYTEEGFQSEQPPQSNWGKGVYLCDNPSYFDDGFCCYLPSGEKQMMMARAILGEPVEMSMEDQTLVKPPLRNIGGEARYDSVIGLFGWPQVRLNIVYDAARTYPAYIITYKP